MPDISSPGEPAAGTKILLGVTGSVAAIKTPILYRLLREADYQVKVVATQASLYFFDPAELDGSDGHRNPQVVVLDGDEWPGRDQGRRWQRDDPVLHIELRRWADLLLIAPLDANTLAKLAAGLADNCLTCVYRAWDRSRPIVLAPAMNTLMWEHPLTAAHLQQIATLAGGAIRLPPTANNLEALIADTNRGCPWLRIVPPVSKQLACGDAGMGALAAAEEIVAAVQTLLRRPPDAVFPLQ
jgi:phosphopantothenoylcysteine decarboxylase